MPKVGQADGRYHLFQGDCIQLLPQLEEGVAHCCITSSPYYGLRDYGLPPKGAHFATFPPRLVERCLLAGCPKGGVVLDPFAGVCTTGLVALQHGRKFLGIEMNSEYMQMGKRRLQDA